MTASPTHRRRKIAFLIGGLCISALLLWLSFRKVDLAQVGVEIAKVNIAYLTINLMLKFVAFHLAALRSRILLRPLHNFGQMRMFKSLLLAFAVNNVVPFRAGELARVGYLSRHGKLPASSCLAVIAVERVTDLFVLAIVFLTVLPLAAINLDIGISVYIGLGAAAGAMLIAAMVSRNPDRFIALVRWLSGLFGSTIRRFVDTRASTFANGLKGLGSLKAVVAVIVISMGFWAIAFIGITVILWALDISLPWYAPVVVLAFLTIGLAVPSTPGNIGTFHYAAAYAMTTLGVNAASAGTFAVISHAISVVPFTVLAVPVLFGDYIKWNQTDSSPETQD